MRNSYLRQRGSKGHSLHARESLCAPFSQGDPGHTPRFLLPVFMMVLWVTPGFF